MDPITGAIAIAGLGIQLFGGGGAMSATSGQAGLASQESQLSQQNTQLQIQENAQRRLAMQISIRRNEVQSTRNAQLSASRSLVAGVGQTGGTGSSGVIAGQQGATSGNAYNVQGQEQQGQIGGALFDIQDQISQNQIKMSSLSGKSADLQGQANIFQGIGAIGGSLSGSAGPLGNILGNFFGNKNDPSASSGKTGGMGILVNQ